MRICAECKRHVKSSPCPFCGTTRSAATLGAPSNAARLSRGELVAGAALIGVLASGCTKSEPTAVPAYGAPLPTESANDPTPPGVLYGGPPPTPEEQIPAPRIDIERDAAAPPAPTPSVKHVQKTQAPAYGGPPPSGIDGR